MLLTLVPPTVCLLTRPAPFSPYLNHLNNPVFEQPDDAALHFINSTLMGLEVGWDEELANPKAWLWKILAAEFNL